LVPELARLRDPASRAPRVQRHRPRSTHPVAALERAVDDVEDEEAVLGLRPRPRATGAAVRRWVAGLALAGGVRRCVADPHRLRDVLFRLLSLVRHALVAARLDAAVPLRDGPGARG